MNPTRPHCRRPAAPRRRGFTLVELMISIALVLLLVLGVNQVFKLTSQTVGTGQVASAAMRDQRAAANVMEQDFAAALTSQSPFFIIHSEAVPAFRNRTDEQSNEAVVDSANNTASGKPLLLDVNGDGVADTTPTPVTAGEQVAPMTYNGRNHRLDAVSFLARGAFTRQTGNPNAFNSATTSNEAMVVYAHGLVRNNMVTPPANQRFHYLPGEADLSPAASPINRNDNHKYASQFVLNRSVTLLRSATTDHRHDATVNVAAATDTDINLRPLSMDTRSTAPAGVPSYSIFESRYDIALTSVEEYAARFAAFLRRYPSPTGAAPTYPYLDQWYRMPWATAAGTYPEYTINASAGRLSTYLTTTASPPYTTVIRPRLVYRSFVNPKPEVPLTDVGAAQATPYFLGGCSQFIVEFAGDFLRQDNDPISPTYGAIVDDQPDGEIDYIAIQTAGVAPNAVYVKRTRWYGMPRDTGTEPQFPLVDNSALRRLDEPDGAIYAPYGPNLAVQSYRFVDVLPIRDVLRAGANDPDPTTNATLQLAHDAYQLRVGGIAAVSDLSPVERNLDATTSPAPAGLTSPFSHIPPPVNGGDYIGTNNLDRTAIANAAAAHLLDYTAAWTFGGPKMVRVLVTVDDPAGRLADGQTSQYVFTLRQ